MSRSPDTREQLSAAVKQRDEKAEEMFQAFISMMNTEHRIGVLLDRYLAEQVVSASA